MMYKLKLLPFIILIFCGCVKSDTTFYHGIVVDKQYTAAHNEMHPVFTPDSKGMIHTTWIVSHVPDEYIVVFQTEYGEYRKVKLSKSEYDSYQIKNHYPHYEKPIE